MGHIVTPKRDKMSHAAILSHTPRTAYPRRPSRSFLAGGSFRSGSAFAVSQAFHEILVKQRSMRPSPYSTTALMVSTQSPQFRYRTSPTMVSAG